MTDNSKQPNVTIDGKEYTLDSLSDRAKSQLENIQFTDARLLQLQNELAVSDTARIAYTNALKNELAEDAQD